MNNATITCLSAVVISFATAQGADPATPPAAAPIVLYDANPEHLWNRLHRTFFAWAGADASPLHWPKRDYSMSSREGIEVLDEFLTTHGENLIKDPLRRALLQHDLWLVFEGTHDRNLETHLLKAIRRLALSPKQIRSLPDNYAAAVAAKSGPTSNQVGWIMGFCSVAPRF